MRIKSYSNSLQFSNTSTELNKLIEDVVDGLYNIAIGVAGIGEESIDLAVTGSPPTKSVASRLVSQSSKFDALKGAIDNVQEAIDRVAAFVESGMLMNFAEYNLSRCRIDNSSEFIEKEINLAKGSMHMGPTHKTAYYQETKIIISYANLVRDFNKCVADYRELHHVTDANFIDADTSLSFFMLKADVSNLPSINHAPENSDIDRGFKK